MNIRELDLHDILGKIGIGATFLVVLGFVAFVTDVGVPVSTEPAIVMANIEQVSEMRNPDNMIQARLQNGAVVNVMVPAGVAEFPIRLGAVVRVTRFESRWSKKSDYWIVRSEHAGKP